MLELKILLIVITASDFTIMIKATVTIYLQRDTATVLRKGDYE